MFNFKKNLRGSRAVFQASASKSHPRAWFVRSLLGCTCAVSAGFSLPVQAAPEEVQVYMDDLSGPGHFGLDVHNNYVISGADTPAYKGELPPRHVYRLTPEFYYGLTKTIELGLYVLTTRDAQGGTHNEGGKVRIKYIAPHDATTGFFWGVNLEAGKTNLRVSEMAWNAQLKGILGYRTGPWTLAINPNLDWSPSKGGGPVVGSLDGKVAYSLAEKTQIGFEIYNELGPVSNPQALNKNSKTLYAVVDQEAGGFDINAGIGRGLTNDADRWVLKFIVGTHF
ncbi:hypothetical protein QN379_14155 [Glaciimonas sp. Gout2]|uniref:hypothetical protein n=1 Tax=unclassified Glaciimonas TaxID=2644401 RepID=UPI002AB3A47C|nr:MULTISPECIES: hypothetical protein [unclassified Glaciimonas]MDY7549215.1 hypothetical protein [Glaciimonas sp. CA11.2]MEB0013949.1 hypothetical protein [Glaciimonas sp. Cout2]MEB0083153.1 hypothetical protein [Glaciimonas sp. Gout2]